MSVHITIGQSCGVCVQRGDRPLFINANGADGVLGVLLLVRSLAEQVDDRVAVVMPSGPILRRLDAAAKRYEERGRMSRVMLAETQRHRPALARYLGV